MNIEELQKEIEQRQLAVEWEQAKASGKPFEVECKEREIQIGDWYPVEKPSWTFGRTEYRRKPVATLVPWTFEYILEHPEIAGAWFRGKGLNAFGSGLAFGEKGIGFANYQQCIFSVDIDVINYVFALEKLEYSTDLKTWKPCGKVKE